MHWLWPYHFINMPFFFLGKKICLFFFNWWLLVLTITLQPSKMNRDRQTDDSCLVLHVAESEGSPNVCTHVKSPPSRPHTDPPYLTLDPPYFFLTTTPHFPRFHLPSHTLPLTPSQVPDLEKVQIKIIFLIYYLYKWYIYLFQWIYNINLFKINYIFKINIKKIKLLNLII